MAIELKAIMTCERCDVEVVMDNIDDMQEAEQRASEAGWCDSDSGETVCPTCWAKFDAAVAEKSVGTETP